MIISYNPSNGQEVGRVEVTPTEAISDVVARARDAQRSWAATPLDERLAALSAAGQTLRERSPEIAELLCREMGKPLSDAHSELRWVTGAYDEEVEEFKRAFGEETIQKAGRTTTVYRDPFGVAVCISPWNFPLGMPHQQVLPALAAGNAVILKPSEETPLTAQAYADCLLQHLPEGVLQVVHGDEAQGKALVSAEIDLIVFTGSRNAGVHILGEASKGLKRVILELGGKDPLVVLGDADLNAAAKFAAHNSFRNAGQVCVSTERIYVEDSVHDAFVDRLVQATEAMKVGDGLSDGVRIGPMINQRQKRHVQGQVSDAVEAGATLRWSEGTDHGNFLGPVISELQPRDGHRPRRDLRPGGVRLSRERRPPRGGAGQRHPLRPRRCGLWWLRARPRGGEADDRRHDRHQSRSRQRRQHPVGWGATVRLWLSLRYRRTSPIRAGADYEREPRLGAQSVDRLRSTARVGTFEEPSSW